MRLCKRKQRVLCAGKIQGAYCDICWLTCVLGMIPGKEPEVLRDRLSVAVEERLIGCIGDDTVKMPDRIPPVVIIRSCRYSLPIRRRLLSEHFLPAQAGLSYSMALRPLVRI